MSEDDRRYQTDLLKEAVYACIDQHIEKYQMTYAEAVGVLECCKYQLIKEMRGEE